MSAANPEIATSFEDERTAMPPILTGQPVSIEPVPVNVIHVVTDLSVRQFFALASKWRRDVAAVSSDSRRMAHPACRRIVAMGWGVVPLILAQIEQEPWHWGGVLAEITGDQPVQPQDAGNLDRIASSWLEWGRAKGIRW